MTNIFFAVFLALLYSIAYTVAGPVIEAQDIKIDPSPLFPFLLCFLSGTALNLFLFSVLKKRRWLAGDGRISRYLGRCHDKVGDRRVFLLVWAFHFVSWIPAWLILYPGVLSYDIISQTGSALGEITINHHPILHTWLIRVFMKSGEALFSSY